jgi:hypothetical protein
MSDILERAGVSILSIYGNADGTVFLPASSTAMWLFCGRN